MDFRIVYVPPFTAVTSGPDPEFDFSPGGALGRFNEYFSAITPAARDSFSPRDFLFFNKEAGGLEWWYAYEDYMPDGGYEKVSFDGGCYVAYTYRDHDDETNNRLYKEVMDFIEQSPVLEPDERPGHYSMGHIITPPGIIEAQGFALMEALVPVRVRA